MKHEIFMLQQSDPSAQESPRLTTHEMLKARKTDWPLFQEIAGK